MKRFLLKEKGIVYDKLLVGKIEKRSSCIENQLDVLIEDEVKYINEMSEFMNVFVFDAVYNKQCSGKNITRVYNWLEIYDKINEFDRNM